MDKAEAHIETVSFAGEHLNVVLSDGRIVSTPLNWYPRLEAATIQQRGHYEVSAFGVHWSELDEDLSLAGMLRGVPDETNAAINLKVRGRKRLPDVLTGLLVPFANEGDVDLREVRVQRESVVTEVLARAKAKIDLEDAKLEPVPNKFLIPFLEKASLEDTDSELLDAWANLLVRSATNFDSKLTAYVQILSAISVREARVLYKLCDEKSRKNGLSWPLGPTEENEEAIRRHVPTLIFAGPDPVSIDRSALYGNAWQKFLKDTRLIFARIEHGTVVHNNGLFYYYAQDLFAPGAAALSIDLLEREKLVGRNVLRFNGGTRVDGSVGYVQITHIGYDLIRTCTRNFLDSV